MPQNFFSRFPEIQYNIDRQGSFLTLKNIVKNVNVNALYANENTYYTFHQIADGERPDIVSYKIYGTPNYYWTFFIINDGLREGLNNSWPLSNQQFERMIEQEYDAYSSITFLPASETLNGISTSGLMNLTYFDSKYLPYLRIINAAGTEHARIARYDNATLQLIIYDIRRMSDGSHVLSRDTFINEAFHYKLSWENPHDEGTVEYDNCVRLKNEFITRVNDVYSEIDMSAIIDPAVLGGDTQEELDAAVLFIKENYVFTKMYLPAPLAFRWSTLRNAASEYYRVIDDQHLSVSAYDVIVNPSIIQPRFISYYEKEEILNSNKSQIRVIRPDRIQDFVNTYFNVLND
jgi:hypothetical protein